MKYLKISLSTIGCLCILLVLYIEFGGRCILRKDDKKSITWLIRTSEKLPENFKSFYDIVYPSSLSKNSWSLYLQQMMDAKKMAKDCPCHTMGSRLMPTLNINNKSSLDYFLLIRYLE